MGAGLTQRDTTNLGMFGLRLLDLLKRGCANSGGPWSSLNSGHARPRQRTEICNFRAPSPLDFFLNFLQWMFFLFSPGFYV